MAIRNGTSDDDVLNGTKKADTIRGKGGDDELFGDNGDDTILGGGDDDLLSGNAGKDVLRGGGGEDVLYGGLGNDKLYGGAAFDVLIGGLGDDLLYGGGGPDRFVFQDVGDTGRDRIYDFKDNVDTIIIDKEYGFANVAAVMDHLIEKNGNTHIDLDRDGKINDSPNIVVLGLTASEKLGNDLIVA